MGYTELTELLLEKLAIELPPVALAFVPERPAEVPVMGKPSPSFCTFWRWGERSVFYAAADQHLECAHRRHGGGLSPAAREGARSVRHDGRVL